MSYIRGWHAWYADGSEFSSSTHTPLQLPLTGLQIIMLYFNDGTRRVMNGNDAFFYHDNGSADGIWGQTDDPVSDIATRYPGAHIMTGQLISDSTYRTMEEAAHRRKEP